MTDLEAHRLELCGGLLRPQISDVTEVKAALRIMPAADRETLRGLVDWIIEYEGDEWKS